MANYLKSDHINAMETDGVMLSPEQRLWKAVFMQAIQDAFGISTVAMNRDEYLKSKVWVKRFTEDFIQVCENAGFSPEQTFEKLKRYDLIKKGIIWNYTTNGKRRFADVSPTN
jgi:hypothetical protein